MLYANIIDTEQMQCFVVSDMGLHCWLMSYLCGPPTDDRKGLASPERTVKELLGTVRTLICHYLL